MAEKNPFLNESQVDGIKRINDSIGRRKGAFAITRTDRSAGAMGLTAPFNLALGAPTAVRVSGGMMVSLGLTAERVRDLRDACDALLNTSPLDELVTRDDT